MKGYLIDTNHVGALFRKEAKVMVRANLIPPENLPRVSTITLGEIEAGNIMTKERNQLKRDAFLAYVYEDFLPYALCVDERTRISYAKIIGKILKEYPKTNPDKRTERHLVEIGVDINDVWIAAVAHQHGMVLVTHDNMEKIKEAISSELVFEDWF